MRARKTIEQIRASNNARQKRYQAKRRAQKKEAPVDLETVITGKLGETKKKVEVEIEL